MINRDFATRKALLFVRKKKVNRCKDLLEHYSLQNLTNELKRKIG